MDPEFGDDLRYGFSGPSDVESCPSSSDEAPLEQTSSLDLLSAMLEGTEGNKYTQKSKKAPRKKKGTACTEQMKSHLDDLSAEESKPEDMCTMKDRMKEMEAELQRLREQVVKHEGEQSQKKQVNIQRTQSGKISSGVKTRKAHQPTTPNWDSENHQRGGVHHETKSIQKERNVSLAIISQRKTDERNGVLTEKYSGLRIKNPLVSSEQMGKRMTGRKMIKIPRIPYRIRRDEIEGDWVTIGVIVDKLPPRDTKKGDKFAVWKLSDLSGQSSLVSIFLFGKAYQEHWKTPQGHVVALLNPSIMPSREGASAGNSNHDTVALSVDHPKKLMLMGVSQDFTICKAQTKSGRKCTNFAKLSDGGHCDYHTRSAYSKTRSHRMEFQQGYGPDSGRLQEKLFKRSNTDMFFCQGQTFVASSKGSSQSKTAINHRDVPRGGSERLFAPGAKESANRVKQELLMQREKDGCVVSRSSGRGVVTQEGSEIFKEMLQKQSAGARMMSKHMEKEDIIKKEADGVKHTDKSARELLREHTVKTEHAQSSDCSTPLSLPILGRGLGPGSMVDLGPATAGLRKASQAKMKAIHLVKRRGQISSAPSSVSNRKKTKIMERVQGNIDTNLTVGNDSQDDKQDCETNPSKRRKLDPQDMERILNAKSSHDWIVKESELEMEQEYFERLEKKENMEEKLQSIKELRVSVVSCKECNYVAEYPGELCKKESHHLHKFKATKKCFQCKACQQKCFLYTGRPPVDNCKKCGGTNYEQTSLYHEHKGIKLPTEQLKLRGDEEKFLNSLY